jgi:demethylmenaquinone methyltransferase/2-methoxy-6-polyprenyl-1,4-benzoquinol methylase
MSTREQVQSYYDDYHRSRSKGSSPKRVRSNLRRMSIQPGDRIIDVGCGLGATGQYISSLGGMPFGLDISLEAVRASSPSYTGVIQASAEALPFVDAAFDGATLMGTLEHFADPERTLLEVGRTVHSDGQICIVVPNGRFFLFRLFGGTGQPHEDARSYADWCELLEAEGLEIEAVYRDIGPGVFEGGWLRGLARKLILIFANLLPLRQTYQFVFVCRNPKGSTTMFGPSCG